MIEKSSCTEVVALVTVTLITFGDAVEMFLPAVITQQVSCELGITLAEEHVAALSLYVSIAIISVIAIPLSNRIGRRSLLLAAMYLGIAATIVCSVASNYIFLVVSRILLGFSLALNLATAGVYIAEIASSRDFYTFSITFTSTAYSVGGGWCGFLGYILLERIGWRYFILLTSLPFFIPPLLLLQLYLPETKGLNSESPENKELISAIPTTNSSEETNLIAKTPTQKAVVLRILKLTLYLFCNGFMYCGDILLVPVIMRDINKSYDANIPCGAIHGIQFLVITGLFGGCHIVGRLLSYFIQDRFSSEAIFVICSLACLPFTVLCIVHPRNTVAVFVSLAFIQTILSLAANETNICINDKEFFTEKYIATSAGILTCVIQISMVVTNVISEVLVYETTLLLHVGCATLYFMISLLFFLR